MTTPTPQRWTDQVRDVLAELIRERLEDLGDEGRDAEGTLDGSLWLDGVEKVADDLAGVILAAGADAGLLVQPHTGPRVWDIPPEDVRALTDAHGNLWHPVWPTQSRWLWHRVNPDGTPYADTAQLPLGDVVAGFGPLTEVLPNV